MIKTLLAKESIVSSFSVVSNCKKILTIKSTKNPLDCLHGIRFLSICYVIVGHRYCLSMYFPLVNSLEIMDVSTTRKKR